MKFNEKYGEKGKRTEIRETKIDIEREGKKEDKQKHRETPKEKSKKDTEKQTLRDRLIGPIETQTFRDSLCLLKQRETY